MHDAVSLRVRRLIADHLGVGPDDLELHASLREDLAADSLDLLEVCVALEDDLGFAVPERLLDEVRTVGDLVTATVALARDRRRTTPMPSADEPVHVSARVIPAIPDRPVLERSEWLTPYALQSLTEDALHAGRGARLEVTVVAGTPAAGVARVAEALLPLNERGIDVHVRREGALPTRRAALASTAR